MARSHQASSLTHLSTPPNKYCSLTQLYNPPNKYWKIYVAHILWQMTRIHRQCYNNMNIWLKCLELKLYLHGVAFEKGPIDIYKLYTQHTFLS